MKKPDPKPSLLARNQELYCPVMNEDNLFTSGVRLFNRGEYFEAHEAWEALWHEAVGEQRDFLQGMIQAAVALHHYKQGNDRGAVYMYGRAQLRLSSLTSTRQEIDLRKLLTDLERIFRPLQAKKAGKLPGRGQGAIRTGPFLALS